METKLNLLSDSASVLLYFTTHQIKYVYKFSVYFTL